MPFDVTTDLGFLWLDTDAGRLRDRITDPGPRKRFAYPAYYHTQPSDAWLAKPNFTGTNKFYEALTDFGWYGLTQSYRPYEQTIRYGPKTVQSFRCWYDSQPQQGWIKKPIVSGTTGDFYEAVNGYGFYQETQAYLPYERRANFGPKAIQSFRTWYDSQPQQGWMAKPVLTGGSALYEAITGYGWFQVTQAYRVYEWTSGYGPRAKSLLAWYETKPNDIFNPNLFDLGVRWPSLTQGTNLPRMGLGPSPRVLFQTDRNIFNPNITDLDNRWAAISQDSNLPRMAPKTVLHPAHVTKPLDVFNPDLLDLDIRYAAIRQLLDASRRTTVPVALWPSPQINTAWIQATFSFDPALLLWIIDNRRIVERNVSFRDWIHPGMHEGWIDPHGPTTPPPVFPPVVILPPIPDVIRDNYDGPPARVTANRLAPYLHGSVYKKNWRDNY